ncbi:hypothetical protein JYB64_15545 [Algoriphagus aestuarii]|nr:hypothetical protein [Algoriphagus aestuarii]
MRNILLALLFLSFSGVTYSQSSESVSFSIPKTVYFGGERIWISGNVENESDNIGSKIIYAELLNRYNESVAIAKMPLNEGASFNFLQLPTDLPSDNYLLRVFTRVSPYQDLELGLVQQFVTVFNRLVPPAVVESRTDFAISKSSPEIRISQETINPGSNFQLEFPEGGSIVELSVAVFNPFLPNSEQIGSSMVYESLDSKEMLPELFGHIVEAKVDLAVVDTTQLYYVSVHGEKSALFTDKPDADGRMFFDAGGMKNWKYLVAQAEGNKSLIDFNIVSPAPKTHFRPEFKFPVLEIMPSDESFLKELLKGGQVEGYFVHEFDAVDFPVVTGFVEDRVYQLDDYTRFETVETIIKEYVPEVSVKTVQKKKEFRTINAIRSFAFDSNPLMLVDAMPVFDSDALAAFDPKGFKTLEILTRTFYLNEEAYPGVLSFSSYKNDFGGYPIPSNGIYLDYQGIQPEITEAISLFNPQTNGLTMDWRTILFWSKIPGSAPKNRIDLKAPELKGTYRVTVKSPNGTYSRDFEVK